MPISIPSFSYKTLVHSKALYHIQPPLPCHIYRVTADWQGYGKINGVVKSIGVNYPGAPVCVFKRDTRQLLWEIKSKSDGSYVFKNIAVGLECFVVAFDPNNQYNAVIQDKVVAK